MPMTMYLFDPWSKKLTVTVLLFVLPFVLPFVLVSLLEAPALELAPAPAWEPAVAVSLMEILVGRAG